MSITPEGNLIVNDIVVNDDGLYQCVATNAAGSDFGVVNLTIYGKNSYILSINITCSCEGSVNNTKSSPFKKRLFCYWWQFHPPDLLNMSTQKL